MSTFTTKLGLSKPADSDTDWGQEYRDAMDTIDDNPGIIVVADSTALAALSDNWEGRLAYNAEDDKLYKYDGTDWIEVGPASVADNTLTTKGDLMVYGTALARLGVGSNGQVLTSDSSQALGMKWATPSAEAIPICHVYHDAQQKIADGTDTVLAFNSERFDTDSIHDNSANNSRLTCKTAGKYLISGHAEFTQHETGLRTLWILLNGTTILAMQKVPGTSVSNNNTTISIQTMWDLEVNDYVELWVRQASGKSLDVLAVNSSPQFMMVKVG